MVVLVLNCGSSSVKFQMVDVASGGRSRRLARGLVERIGEESAFTYQEEGGAPEREAGRIADHDAAIRRVIEQVRSAKRGAPGFGAVGHRVVHGGHRFVRPALIDREVVSAIEAVEELAPLHNGPSLAGIRAARKHLGGEVSMVAVFDTAFHAALPAHASLYAIPYDLSRRYRIRRYGFHGISYQYLVSRYSELTGTPRERARLVIFHLGNGCSVAAVEGGRSVDTSMGFTPLEGLVMGTRSGDLDPAVVGYLAERQGVPPAEIERLLNEGSGLLGLSGTSRDVRDLLPRAPKDERARLALDIFCYRARKYLGAYLAVLGGAEAVVFSGGIGEHQPEIRAGICAGMEWCGLTLDPGRNAGLVGREGYLSPPAAKIAALVIPTDEELVIARETAACIAGSAASGEP